LRTSLVDTFIARSFDGGNTFEAPVRVSSVTSNWCTGTVNIRPNFGDYIGAVTNNNNAFVVWADDRNTLLIGGVQRNVVDVFFAKVGTIPGDINGDFRVNILDGGMLATAYGSRPGDPNWIAAADLAHHGVIDILDAGILAYNYGSTR
jgi:hypothetical protein